MQINQRVEGIPLSRTLALDARAKELAASGRDIVNMTAGEPDFDSPDVVRTAAKRAIDSGRVKYTPAPGRLDLRETIADYLTRTRGVAFHAGNVTVCHSGKHALSGSLLTLISPGDEVLLTLPAWVSYVEQVRFAGGEAVGVPPRADMGPDFDAMAAALTPRTRGIMINSPNNPSGYVTTREEFEQLAQFARKHDLWILSDEIYGRLTYEDKPYGSPVQCGADARERTIIVDGASKTFAMTGYRIGFVAAPERVANAVANLHSQLTGAPNAISQDAFQAALQSEPAEVDAMCAAFISRRDHILGRLARMGLKTPHAGGAFYVFPDITSHWPNSDCDAFCEAVLDQEGLALVPGSAFGVPGHVRLSYAASMESIDRGLDRLERFLASRP
jgi:aspartate aminotransferase